MVARAIRDSELRRSSTFSLEDALRAFSEHDGADPPQASSPMRRLSKTFQRVSLLGSTLAAMSSSMGAVTRRGSASRRRSSASSDSPPKLAEVRKMNSA